MMRKLTFSVLDGLNWHAHTHTELEQAQAHGGGAVGRQQQLLLSRHQLPQYVLLSHALFL